MSIQHEFNIWDTRVGRYPQQSDPRLKGKGLARRLVTLTTAEKEQVWQLLANIRSLTLWNVLSLWSETDVWTKYELAQHLQAVFFKHYATAENRYVRETGLIPSPDVTQCALETFVWHRLRDHARELEENGGQHSWFQGAPVTESLEPVYEMWLWPEAREVKLKRAVRKGEWRDMLSPVTDVSSVQRIPAVALEYETGWDVVTFVGGEPTSSFSDTDSEVSWC